MLRPRKKMKVPKLNLVPIMDAIFIFIFFLLLSAQFLDIHEIKAEAPVVATYQEEKHKKEPLNLMLEIDEKQIIIKTGVDGNIYKKLDMNENLTQLHTLLIELKGKNISEQSVIVKPAKNLEFKKIVSILDQIRGTKQEITGTNDKGEIIKTNALFPQIIFESIM